MKIASNICCNKRHSIYHTLYEDHLLVIYYTLCLSIISACASHHTHRFQRGASHDFHQEAIIKRKEDLNRLIDVREIGHLLRAIRMRIRSKSCLLEKFRYRSVEVSCFNLSVQINIHFLGIK